MADIICRWRNGTPQTVVELVNALPHEKMPIDEFRSIMEKRWEGFFRTAYQLACQLALYCESEDGYYYPRFDHNITESEARSWLLNWLPKYYVPNPFTKKDGFNDIECPTFVLKALYDYVREHGVCSYALAFKNVFHEETRNNDDIIKNYINNYSRVLSFSKYGNLEIVGSYEEVFGDMNRNDKKGFFDSFDEKKCVSTSNLSSNFTPSQIIYYGVPGCGKSHTITTMLKDEKAKAPTFSEENQVVRTTFHPEYTNADFIGQILPEVHEDSQGKSVVEYKFKPGPFAKILKQALHNPSRPFYLVIEEINRGNAAAIFGDVFQLLDRLKNGDTTKEPVGTDGFENQYGKGWSEYFVMNADVNAYIRDAKSDDELDTKSIDVSGIHFSSSTGLRLPPNLSIYATMNTSDQNVFTLDNAFQRRWDMELVSNTCKWNDEDHKKQAKLPIGDTDIRWETFRKAINGEISDGDFFNADDKQLGLFFIEAEGDKIDGKKFANKVLKYLWADVFKRDTGKIFKSENLSKVVEDFTGTDAFDKVFVEDFAQSLKNANDEIKNHE